MLTIRLIIVRDLLVRSSKVQNLNLKYSIVVLTIKDEFRDEDGILWIWLKAGSVFRFELDL